jgi:hypothetical protein
MEVIFQLGLRQGKTHTKFKFSKHDQQRFTDTIYHPILLYMKALFLTF